MDECVGKIVDKMTEKNGSILITADHGNADQMLDEAGAVVTAHSTNPVPLILVNGGGRKLADGGALCDLSPTLLTLMGLEIPKEMEGKSLLV